MKGQEKKKENFRTPLEHRLSWMQIFIIFSFSPNECWNLLQIIRGPVHSMSSIVLYSLSSYYSKSRNLSYWQRYSITTNINTSKPLCRKSVSRADIRPRNSRTQSTNAKRSTASLMGRKYSNVSTSVKVWNRLNVLHRTVQYSFMNTAMSSLRLINS
jgi:hypothetical protein